MVRFNGFEWARLAKNTSGLPFDIFIDSLGCSRNSNSLPQVRVEVDSKRRIPVSIDKISPKILSDKVSQKEREKIAEVTGFIAAAYDILIAYWNHFLLSDREALRLLENLAKYRGSKVDSAKNSPCHETLVLCVGDGALNAIDEQIHWEQDTSNALWFGWNADIPKVPGQNPNDMEQRQREAKQCTIKIIKENKFVRRVIILAAMNEKPSTYIIPVIAKVFREHNIQAIGIITTDFDSMTAFQQKAVNEEIERLRKQSNLLLTLSCNTLAQGISSEGLLWRAAQLFINEPICGI